MRLRTRIKLWHKALRDNDIYTHWHFIAPIKHYIELYPLCIHTAISLHAAFLTGDNGSAFHSSYFAYTCLGYVHIMFHIL